MPGVVFDEIEESALAAPHRRVDFHFVASAVGEGVFEQGAVFKIKGNVNHFWQVFGVEIQLLEKRRHKFVGIKGVQFLPIKFAAVNDAAAAQVKEIGGDKRRFGVVGQNVSVVALRCRDALALFDVLDGAEEIAIGGGFLKVLLFGGGHHALLDAFHKVMAAAVEKHADIAHGFSVAGVGGKAGDAGSEAAVNVILQAGAGMILREIDKTRGNKKALVNEVQDAASEAGRKVGTKIERAVFLDAAREINAGIFFGQSELDIGISLIVAKDDVELGLVLLDEIVFEGEGLALVGNDDGFEVGDFPGQRAGFGVGPARLQEVGTHTVAQGTCFTHIDDGAAGVLEEVHAGLFGEQSGFFAGFHADRSAAQVRPPCLFYGQGRRNANRAPRYSSDSGSGRR